MTKPLLDRLHALLTSLDDLNDHDCAAVLAMALFAHLNHCLQEELSNKVISYIYEAIADHITRFNNKNGPRFLDKR